MPNSRPRSVRSECVRRAKYVRELRRETTKEVAEYLEAARCKVKIARFHHEKPDATLAKYPPETIVLQAHFEGLLYAVVAVFEKLVSGLAVAAGLKADARPA
jgi:hypothetical protein